MSNLYLGGNLETVSVLHDWLFVVLQRASAAPGSGEDQVPTALPPTSPTLFKGRLRTRLSPAKHPGGFEGRASSNAVMLAQGDELGKSGQAVGREVSRILMKHRALAIHFQGKIQAVIIKPNINPLSLVCA